MNRYKDLALIFTGSEISVGHLKSELVDAGIPCHVQNDFGDGMTAGRGNPGPPYAIDVYVRKQDVDKATEIVKQLKSNLS